ncbi:MAG: hypothetical protein HC799_00020 [Limnothrix sp. RL_2_0]|nr:hypothetical protein [Limnothrix sp. RL_2_0]
MLSLKPQQFALITFGAIAFSSLGLLPKIISQAGQNVSYEEVTYIEPQHPLGVALAAAREKGYVDSSTWKETIEIEHSSAETLNQAQIAITQEGFLDDSVRGHQFFILVEKDELGQWQVVDIQKIWLCQRGNDLFGQCL